MKELKVIYNKYIPFKSHFAITIFGKIYIRDFNKCYLVYKRTFNHEGIHICQTEDFISNKQNRKFNMILGHCIFYMVYFLEWLLKIIPCKIKKKNAYRSISFEQEAYDNERNYEYQNTRKRFNWTKYLFKLV